jgi:hypothetical protein
MKKTIAETIADQFQNDGQRFDDNEGNSLRDVLEEKASKLITRENSSGYNFKFIFKDNSSIILFYDCWDIGKGKAENDFSTDSFGSDPENEEEYQYTYRSLPIFNVKEYDEEDVFIGHTSFLDNKEAIELAKKITNNVPGVKAIVTELDYDEDGNLCETIVWKNKNEKN